MQSLELLLNRHSCSRLQSPAPEGEDLHVILQAGLTSPDHGGLTPWEFIVAQGEGLTRLGEIFAKAAERRGESQAVMDKARQAPLRAPLVITVVAKVQSHDKVPPLEQYLSAGCCVVTMQMAALAQGFNGFWRSGWYMYDRGIHEDLGLAEQDQIVGFLYLGTPATDCRTQRQPQVENYYRML